jgi:glycosyltransferase involved in cell wall biosynthesis
MEHETQSSMMMHSISSSKCELSVIVPVYNEVGNLKALHEELASVLAEIKLSYEIIFIDDGSLDGSLEVLKELKTQDPNIVIIQFRRNFGQTAAFAAGFDFAAGDLIVTIDADGQNNPMDIPRLIDKMNEEDCDLVIGQRMNRQEPLIRRVLSNTANRIISRSTHVYVHDRGCSLKLFKRDLAKSIRLYGQLHRYLPELASMVGAKVAEVPTIDRKRRSGKSKYGSISRTPRVVLDLLTVFYFLMYSTSPMRLFGSFALVGVLGGGSITGYLGLAKIYNGITGGWAGFHAYEIGNRPLLLIGIFMILISVQFFMIGLIGEMIVRVYYEAGNKPIYYVREVLK